jgi:hypothetical protein
MSSNLSNNRIPKLKPMHKAQIRTALSKIVHEGPSALDYGVCWDMEYALQFSAYMRYSTWAAAVILEWPEYSGEKQYPVPCTKPAQVPKRFDKRPAQWAYGHLPKWKGAYGSARHRYIAFLLGALVNA